MPLGNSRKNRKRKRSEEGKGMRNTGGTSNADLNKGAGTMHGVILLTHLRERGPLADLEPELNIPPVTISPGIR